MNFASDNWAGAHRAISENLERRASGYETAYGAGEIDKLVEKRFCEIFERDLKVFFVATGTIANSLAMAAAGKPGGVAFCHTGAHMIADECGAPELQSGLRLHGIAGPHAIMDAGALQSAIEAYPPDFVHGGQAAAVSVTQATELGTVYDTDAIAPVAEVCRKFGLPLHMDGARFANALVGLDSSPADMTWKSGVDMMSFGGTKNGCWCAEAVVIFEPKLAAQMAYYRKRAGHLLSKSRFVAAQFEAYFTDDLWLQTARHANRYAAKLAALIDNAPDLRLAWQPRANEVFAITKTTRFTALKKAGLVCGAWRMPSEHQNEIGDDETLMRLVTSFATGDRDIGDFARLIS